MRSSIACAKCRRSKTKCENDGVHTTCKACKAQGRVCQYPPSGTSTTASTSLPRRESHATAPISNGEVPKKRKRVIPSGGPADIKDKDDPLDLRLLNHQVWKELLDIFDKHFATDLPFIRAISFLSPFKQTGFQSSPTDTNPPRPPYKPALLLAFLSLTAPFCATLVDHYSRRTASSHPNALLDVSTYYAQEAASKLDDEALEHPEIEHVQALLMLGLHQWNSCQNVKSWITIRKAISLAQFLGLQYEPDLDPMKEGRAKSSNEKVISPIDQEINRRTFWSCFIFDRYFCYNQNQPSVLRAEDIYIQLPCSEHAFNFGENVKTMLLDEDCDGFEKRHGIKQGNVPTHHEGAKDVKYEYGKTVDSLARFIRAVNLFGRVLRWSCAGGRRLDQTLPPWNEKSQFWQLDRDLEALKGELPRDLILSPSMTEVHIHSRSSRNYVHLHAAIAACTIALYREYLVQYPFKKDKPEGPMDPPTLNEEPPEGNRYWEDMACQCFKSARDFGDLMSTCRERDALVETPLSALATYYVVACILYCRWFPKMDQQRYLSRDMNVWKKTWKLLSDMSNRSRMAYSWSCTMVRWHDKYTEARDVIRTIGASPASSESSGNHNKLLSVGEGGAGLKEYAEIEGDLKNFTAARTGGKMRPLPLPKADDDGSESGSPVTKVVKTETASNRTATPEHTPRGFLPINPNPHSPAPSAVSTSDGTASMPNNVPHSFGSQSTNHGGYDHGHQYDNYAYHLSPSVSNHRLSQTESNMRQAGHGPSFGHLLNTHSVSDSQTQYNLMNMTSQQRESVLHGIMTESFDAGAEFVHFSAPTSVYGAINHSEPLSNQFFAALPAPPPPPPPPAPAYYYAQGGPQV